MKKLPITILLAFAFCQVYSQSFTPGFNKEEYKQLMLISARTAGEKYAQQFDAPTNYKMIYRSDTIGLDNLWDFWTANNSTAVISIRGTTPDAVSWLANFYAAMVPAKGKLKINDTTTFHYQLAANPKAAVHVGWLLSTAYLSKDMLPKIKAAYSKGTKSFYIIGHSQGGAIAYLLTAYLINLRLTGELPADLKIKTYCSAAPKPGNLYFAYEYEAMTQGWAYNVVNAADWVPEVPFSIQTTGDFNTINPFTNVNAIIKKQKFPNNLIMKYAYNRLDKPTKKAQRNFQKYLGGFASKAVGKTLPGFSAPDYYSSNHYVRTGATVVLLPDDEYYKKYPDTSSNVFIHHLHAAYLMLLDKLPAVSEINSIGALAYTPGEADIKAAKEKTKPLVMKKLFMHANFGLQGPNFDNINTHLAAAGFMKFNSVYFTRGAGLMTLFPQARLATLLNYQTYTSNKVENNFDNSLRATVVGTSLGYMLLRSSNTHLIPFAGINYSWFGARISKSNAASQSFDDYLNSETNQQHISYNSFASNVGFHVSFMPFINKKFGSNTLLGLKAGYVAPLGSAKWKTNATKLSDGPKTNTQGWYVYFMIGTAL